VQNVLDGPRAALTVAQVQYLIRDSPAVTVSAGLELLDANLNVTADISDSLVGGTVSRASYAVLHGTASLELSTALDWGQAIVRPFYVMTDGALSARFNLGAYYTSVPTRDAGLATPTYTVSGFDILHNLNTPVGEAYSVDTGSTYLSAVASILTARGSVYVTDQTASASVLPSPKVWPFDDKTTWLAIVNDLLAAIGYRGIFSDWNGVLHCEPYRPPNQRAPEWLYDIGPLTSMLSVSRVVTEDYFDAPNRWVYYRSNNVDSTAPVEGNGIYTYVNASTGPTSILARNGRVITAVRPVDVADQASLVSLATAGIDADLRLIRHVSLTTFPNPLHWHFDRVYVTDASLTGTYSDVLVTNWSLPLDGSDMSQEWTIL